MTFSLDMNESFCYRFYNGHNTTLTIIESPVRFSLPDLISITSLSIFLLFLIITLPNAIRRFRRNKGAKRLRLGYYIFIWADVILRSVRQIIITAAYKGLPVEDPLTVTVRLVYETVYYTSELGVMVIIYRNVNSMYLITLIDFYDKRDYWV